MSFRQKRKTEIYFQFRFTKYDQLVKYFLGIARELVQDNTNNFKPVSHSHVNVGY